jgi:hypothetical protein
VDNTARRLFFAKRQKSHRHTSAGTAPDHSCHNVAVTEFIFFSSWMERFFARCPGIKPPLAHLGETILALFNITLRGWRRRRWSGFGIAT